MLSQTPPTTSTAKTPNAKSAGPVRSAIVQDGVKKVHSTYPDGTECVEHFDLKSDDILLRRWRRKTVLGAYTDWEYEIGEPPAKSSTNPFIKESDTAPKVHRRDSKDAYIWRIRNLPYPKSTYLLSIDESKRFIVVRTTNKKYYTKISIPDFERMRNPIYLEESNLSFDWGANTLVVRYKKPPVILQQEHIERVERAQLESKTLQKDGDVDCKQQ
ncbi:hypothetical protein HDV05_006332 [Chytridiales sp. JEL 0842]|nr:hypothetical protein HDV05_006332 [Chytridiales sp. JEL 0842]